MNESDFKALCARLDRIAESVRHSAMSTAINGSEKDAAVITDAVSLLRVYRDALGWIASHGSVSIAGTRRKQMVAAGACFKGERPDVVLSTEVER